MKKFLAIILCAIMLLPAIPITVGAEWGTRYGDYLYYGKYFDYIKITDCDANAVSVNIPAEIDGLPVTSIGDNAFNGCSSLTSITIPNSVTSIGDRAFYDCSSLTSITIPNSVTSIAGRAFEKCDSLTSVTIPNGVTSIDKSAFNRCGNLNITVDKSNPNYSDIDGVLFNKNKTEIIAYAKDKVQPEYSIPNSVINIGNRAFEYCESLTNITIPSNVTSVGDMVFYGCSNLTSVTISNGVTSIGGYAFYNCNSLTNITIPNSVTSIGYSAFCSCDSLTSVTVETGVTSIGNSAFLGCFNLTSVTIPSSVTSIGDGAFYSCGSLNISVDSGNKNYCDIGGVLFNKNKTEIIAYAKDEIQPEYTIPNGVTSIGDRAFYYCDSLTSVTMPDSVTSIGEGAFEWCESLTRVTIPSSVTSIGDWAFSRCPGLTSVTISDSVTSIGKTAFYDCSSLANVIIGNGVISIGDHAFYNCNSLTDVYYSGNEADWQKIIIEVGNEDLTGATIHYNSDGDGHPQISVSKPVVEGGSITITAETKSIDGEGELFAVGYDGNKLTASEKLQDGAATLPAEDVKTIKVFCWDSLDTMRPLCEPKTITIK